MSVTPLDVENMISEREKALQTAGEKRRNVILAALSEISAPYFDRRGRDGDDRSVSMVRE